MRRRLAGAVLLASLVALFLAGSASSASITSNGPLTSIAISDTLNCSVNHASDFLGEFYGDSACGTFIAVGGAVYGPAFIPAGDNIGQTSFTPVSQVGPTGSGTTGDPYRIVTVVDAGLTGIRITETDTYVVGQEAYRTDLTISNPGGAGAIVYRAGDCFLQNDDTGLGVVGAGGAVGCKAPSSNRIEQWLPITGGSSYMEGFFDDVWRAIGAQQPFPNTCRCDEDLDNGAGLSWSIGGGVTTLSHLTTFSPTGVVPLTMAKSADAVRATVGTRDGYTITIFNSNASDAVLSSVVDELPAGFSYVPGSTTGATTADPTVLGRQLTWASNDILVPKSGTASLHFLVVVSSSAGTYFNSASANARGNFVVGGTGPTAPIEVQPVSVPAAVPAADVQVSESVTPRTLVSGGLATYRFVVTNRGPSTAGNVVLTATLASGLTFVSASASQGGCSGIGPISCALGGLPNGASATVTIVARAAGSGSLTGAASVRSDQTDPAVGNNVAAAAVEVLPPPVPGKQVNAVRVRGTVLVDGRALTTPEQVKVGAVIDTRKGEVRLITKNGDASFHDGIFQLRQKAQADAVTELVMRGGNFASCKAKARKASLVTPLATKKPVRKLWGKGKGKFRTRARYSSATVRGTEWLTADRCDGTLTQVRQGTVVVDDFVAKKKVFVRAGQSYVAKAQAEKKGKSAKKQSGRKATATRTRPRRP